MKHPSRILSAAIGAALSLTLTCQSIPAFAAGEAWINSNLKGAVTADTIVRPQDDFAAYANKDWLASADIADGYTRNSALVESTNLVRQRKLSLIGNPRISSHEEDLVTRFYDLATDWDARNALGVEPGRPYIEMVEGIRTLDDLTRYLGDASANFTMQKLIVLTFSGQAQDVSTYLLDIGEFSYSYPAPEDYVSPSETAELYDLYDRDATVYMLQRFGYSASEAEDIFEARMKVEGELAKGCLTTEERYAADAMEQSIHECTFAELSQFQGNFPLQQILTSLGLDSSPWYNVSNPRYLEVLSNYYTQDHVDDLRKYFLAITALGMIDVLDRPAYDYLTELNATYMEVGGELSLEDYGLDCVDNYLPLVMDHLYIDQFTTRKMKEDVVELTGLFKEYYARMLQDESWLSPRTRQKAIEKLNAISVEAVYPEKRLSYHYLSLEDCDSFFEACRIIQAYENASVKQRKIGKKVDKLIWEYPTSTVNAWNELQQNTLYILAGVMTPPNYREDMSFEGKLAILGADTIGHELSHAFDTDGALLDQNGNFNNWWTDEDYEAFLERAQNVADYYSSIVPKDINGDAVNGEQVVSEAIADLGGTKAALAIAADHPGFDYDLFFRAFALQWRTIMERNGIMDAMNTDNHPLGYLRINAVLQQFPEFYETYHVQPGDGMYLAPEDRTMVW